MDILRMDNLTRGRIGDDIPYIEIFDDEGDELTGAPVPVDQDDVSLWLPRDCLHTNSL